MATTLHSSLHAAKPNVIFIFSDDHATQSISAYGSKINHTPNIDRIAKEGALFQANFCTNSICGPSRASILTGKHSHKNGFKRNGNRFEPINLSQSLAKGWLSDRGLREVALGHQPDGVRPMDGLSWSRQLLPTDYITPEGKKAMSR